MRRQTLEQNGCARARETADEDWCMDFDAVNGVSHAPGFEVPEPAKHVWPPRDETAEPVDPRLHLKALIFVVTGLGLHA